MYYCGMRKNAYTLDEIVEYLDKQCGPDGYGSQYAYAKHLGISPFRVMEVRHRYRKPSLAFLRQIGFVRLPVMYRKSEVKQK